tara:strand:+ start:111 stop:914 length:804 start_codon:yes stop_codon:yes gene_type:complete
MKKLLPILLLTLSFAYAQGYDYQELCIECAEQDGLYCGDDPANWTSYSPNGCVPNGLNGLFYLNDGWEDCIDASDETSEDGVLSVPTTLEECAPPVEECDTVYVDIPIVEYVYQTDTLEVPFYIYETIIEIDTLYQTEYITQIVIDTIIEEIEVFVPEYIYVTDTVYADVLDTMFIDVIEYVEVVVLDTVIETEYIEFFITDTIVEYQDVIVTEYLDCDTGMPCNSSLEEVIDNSKGINVIYNLLGQPIKKPKGVYIENGNIKYKID